MPLPRSKHGKQLDSRGPLIFGTRTLGPGSARSETRTVPAPAELSVELIGVPEGADLELDVQLEGVAEGVLVTASVVAPLTGECARCLDPFTSSTRVRLQELFTRDPDHAGPDGYLLTGDLVDLEPALRDALVLELPLSPLCAEECQGLCPECGIRLADAGAGHGHEGDAGVWAALRDFQVADGAWRDDAAGPDAGQDAEAPGGPPAREAAKKEH
jgi:uncharacterized protein